MAPFSEPKKDKPDSKPRHSIKMTPGLEIRIRQALDLLETTYGVVLEDWSSLPPSVQEGVLDHSPGLLRLKRMGDKFSGSR